MMRWLSISLFMGVFAICLYPAFGQESASAVSSDKGFKKKEAPSDGGQDTSPSSIKSCQFCHQIGLDNAPDNLKKDSLARFDESRIWSEKDIHSKSFKVLVDSKLGKQMNAILEPVYKMPVSQASQCLACHSNTTVVKQVHLETESEKEGLGITCVVCHSKNHEKNGTWVHDHYEEKKWRETHPIEKSENFGMKDLRNPEVKATLCASCHIGNAAEKKVVTHQMYAAGHPPLPPFEIVTFMDSQPKHWAHPSGVSYLEKLAAADSEKCWKLYHYRSEKEELHNARNLAVSAIVSFRTAMDLIAHQSMPKPRETTGLMDFAHFDCLACHHDLRIPSDRQSRGYAGSPGRPSLKAWSSVLPRIVIDHAAAGSPELKQLNHDFQIKFKALEDAVLSQPFGNPDKMNLAAKALVQWSDAVLKALEDPKLRYTKEETEKLLKSFIDNGNNAKLVTDPEAAWQIAWATEVLSKALAPETKSIETNLREKLDNILPLTVRAKPGSPSLTEDGQHTERQKKLNDFSSKSFREIFSDLQKQK